ncbi:MAG: type II toxin-antitoxin system RelE/ParE family toxin [Myxococcales bacterium]|nr:MAG: type II toxin-antitoxin system RelE/ParE family toxin [Myxococcales bacterium]
MDVVYFRQATGKEPVRQYIDKLPSEVAAYVLAAIKDIKEHGLDKALVTCRQIEGKLWEIKIDAQRVFYVVIDGPTMVLLHAYKKQGQKAPKKEISVAKKRMKLVIGGHYA